MIKKKCLRECQFTRNTRISIHSTSNLGTNFSRAGKGSSGWIARLPATMNVSHSPEVSVQKLFLNCSSYDLSGSVYQVKFPMWNTFSAVVNSFTAVAADWRYWYWGGFAYNYRVVVEENFSRSQVIYDVVSE